MRIDFRASQEISCTVVALLILTKCFSSDALREGRSSGKQLKAYLFIFLDEV